MKRSAIFLSLVVLLGLVGLFYWSGQETNTGKDNLIIVDYPQPNEAITSPLTITGRARGPWFFEASFPVILTDWDGRIINEHYAEALSEWMTDDFVPFRAVLEFTSPVFPQADKNHFSRRGALILKKDNPSGLPEYDDALEIPIWFAGDKDNFESGENNISVITSGLTVPWEIAFLPEGDILLTERPGTLRLIRNGKTEKTLKINGVRHIGESGLLGLTLHPQFAENRWLYVYLTTEQQGRLINRVERYHFADNQLTDRKIILDAIPAGANHSGGRLAFDPNGYLFVTTGDAGRSNLAQDTDSLAGKILRLRDDGTIPPDNPFNNAVFSYGHRNPQGLAWDQQNRLWVTEHGRSGPQSGLDEINLIQKGGNYGWPASQGDTVQTGTIGPALHSGPDTTWAPSGLTFTDGSLWFAGLRGQTLYQAVLTDGRITALKEHFKGEFGRLRAVVAGPDGRLYLSTSNRDGRGQPRPDDDKIIALNLP